MLIVFAYDIPDNRRRNRVAHILSGVAHRVQYSVFEGILDDRTLNRVVERLARTIEADVDRVRVYRICATCKAQTVLFGRGELTEEPDVIIL